MASIFGKKKEVTILSKKQIQGDDPNCAFSVEYVGGKCTITDFAILMGGYVDDRHHIGNDRSPKGRTGKWFLQTKGKKYDVLIINQDCEIVSGEVNDRDICIRPVISVSNFKDLDRNLESRMVDNDGVIEVEYGEYPQYVVEKELEQELKRNFDILRKTGKTYTIASSKDEFSTVELEEYEYGGRKFVRVPSPEKYVLGTTLSNGSHILDDDYYWVEVTPITWIVDKENNMLISKNLLTAGFVLFYDKHIIYSGDFSTTEMYKFLNENFIKDIIPSKVRELNAKEQQKIDELKLKRESRKNPYGLNFDDVSEEDIIRGALESGLAVFLHGQSSEGKSARVKQIDPDCVIVYLRNTTPEMLNGKSAYNSETGEMVDVKPSWLVKLEKKCEAEPDKLHIVFFDEITNALPSVQGMAYNIVLDKEVNGMWKLPENARIVAAGNDMTDSLAANQLAEPLFNRFAHVYIKTTPEAWLNWASEHNIHPAIYAFMVYKKGEVLRSEYNGETPNADPRKWEMASKMLYATGNPEMLRALVGEGITREFVNFCKQRSLLLADVIMGNYTDEVLNRMDTEQKYATVMGLTTVDEANLETVRNFVKLLGEKYIAVFDTLWVHGDEARLEVLAELKMVEEFHR